jgi:hypothetical protein
LNKPKGRKKGSRQYKKAVREEGEERKQASKQSRLSFCTDYNNKLQLRLGI